MDDWVAKGLALLAMIAALIFDWPRAIAGLAVGMIGRYRRRPWTALVLGVPLVAGVGELTYWLLGRTEAMSWGGFAMGLVVAGLTAYGIFRVLLHILDDVQAS